MTESRKGAAWREYQETAARLFRQMGFNVTIEETIDGARAKHEVDVVARTTLNGIATLWIVECKYWKASVPKAHVLTFVQVAQDVGANHGFLLSEKGFQSGAVAAARKTNVSLSAIDELKAIATDGIAELSIRQSLTNVKTLERELQDVLSRQRLRTPPPAQLDETLSLLGACLEVTMAATAALASLYPVRLPTLPERPPARANEPTVVAAALCEATREIEARSAALKATLSMAVAQAAQDVHQLIGNVHDLVAAAEALLHDNQQSEEAKLGTALHAMRAVGAL